MTDEERAVQERLAELGIAFERHEHPPVPTVEEAERYWSGIDATHCKNLFLRNQKGDRHYLVVLKHSKKADLRAVADQIGDGKLSFASPERLMKHLGLTPGSERLSFHPNINTVTFVVSAADFSRFLQESGNRVQFATI
jgi:Ala-tRNA(Pro) deacylase